MIYIVRHGETNYNKEKRCQGHTNTKLNEAGIKQALELKDKLKDIQFDLIFCSPLDRAIDTAKIITNQDIIVDNRLIERNNGEFEGRTKDEIKAFIKTLDNYNPKDYGLETLDEVQIRVNDFFNEIKSKYSSKNILIVTHGGVIINARCLLEGEPADGNIRKYKVDNCQVLTYKN